jgi:hypothetical protein
MLVFSIVKGVISKSYVISGSIIHQENFHTESNEEIDNDFVRF